MSGYVLDGIPTAMTREAERHYSTYHVISCSCGWGTVVRDRDERFGRVEYTEHMARLRFHYTHCPDARMPPRQCGVDRCSRPEYSGGLCLIHNLPITTP